MSRSSRRRRHKEFAQKQLQQTATANTTPPATANMPYNTSGLNLPSNVAGGMPGITTPSYMDDSNPYNAGILPQDIPVQDARFDIESKKPFVDEVVTRKIVWDYYRTAIALPNPSKILGKLNENIDAFDELLADGRVKACFNNRRSGLLSLKYTIDQNNSPAKLFKLVQKTFESFDLGTLMSDLSLATMYGYNIAEVNWEIMDGLYIPEKVVSKAARWFWYDDMNQLRIRTKVNQTLGEPLPPRKFLVAGHHQTYENPYGEPLLEACYWPCKFRHILYQYAMQYSQKYAMPWLDVTVDANLQETRLREILDAIQSTYEDGIIAHPDNTKISIIPVDKAGSTNTYTQMLDVVNREIDLIILGCNLATEVTGGSYAAAQAHMGIRSDLVDEDRRMMERVLNQLISWIAWYNFPADIEIPKFRLYKIEPATLEKAQIDEKLTAQGIRFTPAYYQRVYQLNTEDFELTEPQQDQQLGLETQKVQQAGASKGLNSKDAKNVRDKTIESQDQTTNTKSRAAMKGQQNAGSRQEPRM